MGLQRARNGKEGTGMMHNKHSTCTDQTPQDKEIFGRATACVAVDGDAELGTEELLREAARVAACYCCGV